MKMKIIARGAFLVAALALLGFYGCEPEGWDGSSETGVKFDIKELTIEDVNILSDDHVYMSVTLSNLSLSSNSGIYIKEYIVKYKGGSVGLSSLKAECSYYLASNSELVITRVAMPADRKSTYFGENPSCDPDQYVFEVTFYGENEYGYETKDTAEVTVYFYCP